MEEAGQILGHDFVGSAGSLIGGIADSLNLSRRPSAAPNIQCSPVTEPCMVCDNAHSSVASWMMHAASPDHFRQDKSQPPTYAFTATSPQKSHSQVSLAFRSTFVDEQGMLRVLDGMDHPAVVDEPHIHRMLNGMERSQAVQIRAHHSLDLTQAHISEPSEPSETSCTPGGRRRAAEESVANLRHRHQQVQQQLHGRFSSKTRLAPELELRARSVSPNAESFLSQLDQSLAEEKQREAELERILAAERQSLVKTRADLRRKKHASSLEESPRLDTSSPDRRGNSAGSLRCVAVSVSVCLSQWLCLCLFPVYGVCVCVCVCGH